MKNIFKKLFSSKVLCFILLFLEFLVVVGIWAFIEFTPVDSASGGGSAVRVVSIVFNVLRAILYVIDLVVFFKIILRDENPEYKIPWLVCMFIVPVWTIVFFLLFGREHANKKDKAIIANKNEIIQKHMAENKQANEELINSVEPKYRGVFNYLQNTTSLDISKGNRITYFKIGETFFPDLVESLKKAEKFIFIEFFIIGDGIWWKKIAAVLKEKASQGVDVRIMFDDMGSSKGLPKDFVEECEKDGIKCHKFHPVMPIFSNAINNRDHRKIVVIDHKIAYTGGINLADEYANEFVKYGYWKDTMVKIEGKAIKNLIYLFLQNYELTTFKTLNYDEFAEGDYPEFEDEGIACAFGDAPGPYINGHMVGEQNYINLLDVATKSVFISSPYLITSYPLTRAITSAAERGVEVNLIVPGIPDKKLVYWMAKSQFHIFLKAGVKIYTYTPGFNHEKLMLVDDRVCFVGTINLDFRSLTHNFECGVTFLDAPCVREVREDFDEMIKASTLVPKDFKFKGFQRFMAYVVKIFRVLF